MYLGKQRKQNRWFGYDYSMPGYYFVMICTQDRICHFGEVIDEKIVLNDLGEIIDKCWLWLPEKYKYIKLDQWQIMPNHVHGIIEIINEDYYNHDRKGKKGLIFEEKHIVGNGRNSKILGDLQNVGNVL